MSFRYSTQRLSYSRRFWVQTRVCGLPVLGVSESFVILDLHGLCGHGAKLGGVLPELSWLSSQALDREQPGIPRRAEGHRPPA